MDKVDIIRKYIGSSDFYDLNGTEMLSKILEAMEEYAQEQVKLFTTPDIRFSFTADEVVNELEKCETLDEALMFFKQNWID